MDNSPRDLLTLFRVLQDKPGLLSDLLERFGSANRLFEAATTPELREAGVSAALIGKIWSSKDKQYQAYVDQDLAWLSQPGHHLLQLGSACYPPLLAQINDPPHLIFCQGNLDALKPFKIAMVGSRSPTHQGLRIARDFATQLASLGVAITSGLAMGIDAASHRGALEVGGVTLAVLGTGCDRVYPARHRALAAEIAETGLLLSDLPLGTPAFPGNFPRRNRLVTGISLGTLVVEAEEKSGSLISARLAMEQGREVFAIPGSIRARQSSGCHRLIRDGVTLARSVEDVLQELQSLALSQQQMDQQQMDQRPAESQLSPVQQDLVSLLGSTPLHVDQLAQLIPIEIGELLGLLIELEIQGLIVNEAGGYCLS